MSNAERQRQFRERNPGYYGRLHARRRAESAALVAELAASAVPAPAEQLMFPAPAPQDPLLQQLAAAEARDDRVWLARCNDGENMLSSRT